MDLQSYLRVVRKRWRIIAATLTVVVAIAILYSFLAPKKYESQVQFFVSTADSSTNSDLVAGGTFTQQRVKSYTELITTPKVLAPIAKEVGVEDATELANKIAVQAPAETVLIDATVRDSTPRNAYAIAKELGSQFPRTVAEIEKVSKNEDSPVKVTTVRDPIVSTDPVSPRPLRNVALAIPFGLLLGLLIALVRDRLDSRLRTKSDVADLTSAPLLGSIPFDKDAPDHPLSLTADGHSGRAEAFRSLRTNLQFIDAAENPRVLVISSSVPGEGKSTTAANLAMVMAESGESVCLIEGDLRRPRLLEYLGLEGGVGITDVLIGKVEARDVLQQFGRNQLWVIGAGQMPPNPSELLGSPRMKAVVDELAERFAYVVIDAPPLVPVTDAAVLAASADGAILVAGSNLVSRDHLGSALESLDRVQANVLGVVLNRAPQAKRRGYYEYGYYGDPAVAAVTERSSRSGRSRSRGRKNGTRKAHRANV